MVRHEAVGNYREFVLTRSAHNLLEDQIDGGLGREERLATIRAERQ